MYKNQACGGWPPLYEATASRRNPLCLSTACVGLLILASGRKSGIGSCFRGEGNVLSPLDFRPVSGT